MLMLFDCGDKTALALPIVCERDILMKILKTALCWQCLRTDQPESSDCAEVLYIYRERERETEKAMYQPQFSSLFAGQLNKQTNGEV